MIATQLNAIPRKNIKSLQKLLIVPKPCAAWIFSRREVNLRA